MDHCPIAQHGQIEAVAVERDELRAQLRDLVAEGGDQFLFCPLAHMRRADGVHCPVISFPVRDQGSDADDGVVYVLRKLIADRLADFRVGFADKIVGGRKPAEVGHSLQVPHDDVGAHVICAVIFRPRSNWRQTDHRGRVLISRLLGNRWPMSALPPKAAVERTSVMSQKCQDRYGSASARPRKSARRAGR